MIQLYGPSRIISKDEVLEVFRDSSVRLVAGKPVKGPPQSFKLQCNVQPMNGYELNLVPEGDRHTENLWLYTNELSTPLKSNDRVSRGGVNYQVQAVETWGHAPNGYQRCRIMRIDVGPEKTP